MPDPPVGLVLGILRKILGLFRKDSHLKKIGVSRKSRLKVVFVHGLRGDAESTWSQMSTLAAEDPELPEIDMASWSWNTGVLVGQKSFAEEAEQLMSSLPSHANPGDDLILVGHNFGGITILQGVLDYMKAGSANKFPCSSVKHLVLYGAPLHGSFVGKLLSVPLSGIKFVGEQLKHVASDASAIDLCYDVSHHFHSTHRIVLSDWQRAVRVQTVVGTRDWLVSAWSATSIFRQPAPALVECGHRKLVQPKNRDSESYLALARSICHVFDKWFLERCMECIGASPAQVREVVNLLSARCGRTIEKKLEIWSNTFRQADIESREKSVSTVLAATVSAAMRRSDDLSAGNLTVSALMDDVVVRSFK